MLREGCTVIDRKPKGNGQTGKQEKLNEVSCSKTLFKNLLMGGEENSSTLQFPLPGNSTMTQLCFSLLKANVGAVRRRIIKLTHRKNVVTLQRRQKKS